MYIVFDIGGTKMRFALVRDNKVGEPIVVSTPTSYVDAIAEISLIISRLSAVEKINGVVGGIAGVISNDGKKLVVSPNLINWVGKPIVDDLERVSGAKVIIKNDTNMVALGEAIYGAGINKRIVAYMTFSTGIGGSLVIAGDLPMYNFGFEPGFQIIDSQDKRSLHSVAGTELKQKYGLLFRDIKDVEIRKNIMRDVVAGIHNAIVFWSPDIFVLGGGMTESFDLEEIKSGLKEFTLRFPELPEFKFAELGDLSGLYGSMEYAKRQLSSKVK